MAAEVLQTQDSHAKKKRLPSYTQIRKTQRYPAKTLFGSVLERVTDKELEELEKYDNPELQQRANDYWKPKLREKPAMPLPEVMKKFVRQKLEPEIHKHGQEVEEYRQRLRLREKRMNLLERDSHYIFELGKHPLDELEKPQGLQFEDRPRWIKKEDLENAEVMNPEFLGPGVKNFNRDKHGKKAESHRYALIGDVLRPGMDFNPDLGKGIASRLPNLDLQERNIITPRTQQRRAAMRSLPPSKEVINGCEIPVNLKHSFGSLTCEALLTNREDVCKTSREIQAKDSVKYKPRQQDDKGAASKDTFQGGKPAYEQLGSALRSNIVGPSFTTNHQISSNHRDFTFRVFKDREQQPDEYRYQKDHVSRWAEANVLEMRMKKALQDHMDELLHKKKPAD